MRVILIIFLCLFTANIYSQSKKDKIIKLLEVLDMKESFNSFFDQLPFGSKKKKEFMKEFSKESKVFFIKTYDKHFTEKEIDEIIKFYSSPVGKRMLKKQPDIMLEAFELGQKISKKLMPKYFENEK